MAHKFSAARAGEQTVFGAQRPGYPSTGVAAAKVDEWIAFMVANGIRRVVCLLPEEQLAYYAVPLLGKYTEVFGSENVRHVSVPDYHLIRGDELENNLLPFLRESDSTKQPTVVHCSGGSGRTGHVLAAWLARARGLTATSAIETVTQTHRNPREAVESGNALEAELVAIISGGTDKPGA